MDPVENWSEPRSPRALSVLGAVIHAAALDAVEAAAHRDTGVLTLRWRDRRTDLAPLWAGAGLPTDVERVRRSSAWADAATRAIPVLVARTLSAGVRQRLSADGVPWADETGRARITLPWLTLVLDDRVAVSAERGRDRGGFAWTPGAGLVAEAVLGTVSGRWSGESAPLPRIADLADITGVSGSWVSRALRAFDAEGWVAKQGPARGPSTVRVLRDPAGLLSSWAAWYRGARPEPIRAHRFLRDAEEWLREVAGAWPEGAWALTGGQVLERRAPFLTALPVVDVYLADDVCVDRRRRADYLDRVGLREVDSGERVRVWPASRESLGLFGRSELWRTNEPQVPDIRLYGDLFGYGVRGEEAAEHLRQVRIGF